MEFIRLYDEFPTQGEAHRKARDIVRFRGVETLVIGNRVLIVEPIGLNDRPSTSFIEAWEAGLHRRGKGLPLTAEESRMRDEDYCRRAYEESTRKQNELSRANHEYWSYMNGRVADDLSASDYDYGES